MLEDKSNAPKDSYEQGEKASNASQTTKVTSGAPVAGIPDADKTTDKLRETGQEKNIFPALPPPPMDTEEAVPAEDTVVTPVARAGPQFLNGLDIYDNVAIKEMESRVYEEIIKTLSQDIIIFKRRIQKLNKQKKITDKQNQDLGKLFGVNKGKRADLREKHKTAKEVLGKIGDGFEEIIGYKENYVKFLELEVARDKGILEDQAILTTDIEELNNRVRNTIAEMMRVMNESKTIAMTTFGKSRVQKIEDSVNKIILARLYKKLLPLDYEAKLKKFRLADISTISIVDATVIKKNVVSPLENDPQINAFGDYITDGEIAKLCQEYISGYLEAMDSINKQFA